MADDLDQLIRAAMKTLDAEVPSGYFETLPNQTIARLEGSMQHGSSGTTDTRDDGGAPPVALDAEEAPAAREEARDDSGLHDIRNLAQSTKQRLSSRRITAPPVADDVLASSSGSFKAIALPQPAKMVSLPAAEDDKAFEKAAKKARKSDQRLAEVAPASALEAPDVGAPGLDTRPAFALPSHPKKSKGPLIALVGTGLAAAAGVAIFLQVNKGQEAEKAATPTLAAEQSKDTAVAAPPPPAPAAPTVEPITPPPAEPAAAAPVESAPAAAQAVSDEPAEEPAAEKAAPKKGAKTKASTKADRSPPKQKVAAKADDKVETKKADPKKPDAKTAPDAKGGGGDDGEPSFDALLKEAGVSEKKEAKPVLEKKSLTGDDFKKGMASVSSKAKGCYSGTQGTATVKLTIAPSGKISKVSVGGDFAGKPEAACIESALRGATFPPWDGGPQSFSYAVLLSD